MDFFANEAILRSIAFGAFLIVQGFVGVVFFIIRYHFRQFGAPDDPRVKSIPRVFGAGFIIIVAASALPLFAIIAR